MRRACERGLAALRQWGVRGLAGAALSTAALAAVAQACEQPVYLTFDTGHMGVAPLVATVLKRHDVKVTFFLANEKTEDGGSSLDDQWAPWWKARAEEGHAFGSHTWDHDTWVADNPDGSLRVRPSQGVAAGQLRTLTPAAYCGELQKSADRLHAITGQAMGSVFRAPAGRVSPALLKAAESCGWSHVGWAPAGFLGDELDSQRFPNDRLLAQALQKVKGGDILVAHLGIWSRQEPWAPAVLEPLIVGLKSRGLCFATLRQHPQLGAAARKARPVSGLPAAATGVSVSTSAGWGATR